MPQVVTLNSKISTLALIQEKPCYEELFERIAGIWNSVCAWIAALVNYLFSSEEKDIKLPFLNENCFCHMIRFLEPEEVARYERVAKSWKTDRIWQVQCANYGITVAPEGGLFKDLFKVPDIAFGPKEWRKHFGKVGPMPPLPTNIKSHIAELGKTHTLTLIPKTVNEQPLTFKTFAPLAKKFGVRLSIKEEVSEKYGDEAQGKSIWLWMQKDLELGSRGKIQAEADRDYPEKLGKALGITVSIVAHYARYKIALFPELSNTRTCDRGKDGWGKWYVIVGSFFNACLTICGNRGGSSEYVGVALTQ